MGYGTELDFGNLVFCIVWSLVWGFATAGVRERKGYGRRRFWLGLTAGVPAFIIACCIPAKPEDPHDKEMRLQAEHYSAENASGWQCSCSRVNAVYVSTCTCGLGKRQNVSSETDASAK